MYPCREGQTNVVYDNFSRCAYLSSTHEFRNHLQKKSKGQECNSDANCQQADFSIDFKNINPFEISKRCVLMQNQRKCALVRSHGITTNKIHIRFNIWIFLIAFIGLIALALSIYNYLQHKKYIVSIT